MNNAVINKRIYIPIITQSVILLKGEAWQMWRVMQMLPKGSFPKQLFKPTNYSSLKQEKQRQKNKKPTLLYYLSSMNMWVLLLCLNRQRLKQRQSTFFSLLFGFSWMPLQRPAVTQFVPNMNIFKRHLSFKGYSKWWEHNRLGNLQITFKKLINLAFMVWFSTALWNISKLEHSQFIFVQIS